MPRKATYQELADAIGVGDRKTVQKLCRERGMPQSVEAAKAWYAATIKGDDGPSEGSNYQRKLAAEAACKEADAKKKQIELERLRGLLVERAAVAATLRKAITAIKNRVEALADELAMLFPPDQRAAITADVRESIRLALTELATLDDFVDEPADE